MPAKRKCRICGCTDDDTCLIGGSQNIRCHWSQSDLCSACAPFAAIPDDLKEVPIELAYRLGRARAEFRLMLELGGEDDDSL